MSSAIAGLLAFGIPTATTFAQQTTGVKQDAKKAGKEAKEAGEATKDAAKATAKGTKHTTRQTGKTKITACDDHGGVAGR